MKRRHLLLMALSLIISICMCFGLAACSSCDDDDDAPAKLSTPVVTIDNTTGVASWLEVENASGYAYVIADGEETATTKLSVQLTDGQTIKVKAKGDGTSYSDSDFSEVQTYTAHAAQPTQLSAPEVTIGDDGTVTIGTVANAVKIVYVIGDGAETDYDANNKPVLAEGQTIKVTAKGDGTNYSDSAVVTKTRPASAPATVMTRAEFVAADDKAAVLVEGTVTAMSGKNVYLQDADGGYYLYGSGKNDTTVIPENLAVGMTIKVAGTKSVYNGLNEITNATIEITDETVKTVTPVDITNLVGNNEAILALQSTYVTVKGATITEVAVDTEKNRTNVTLTVGDKTVVFYIGGTQVVTSEQQTAISEAFKANEGKTADITAIATLFSNNPQLIPANAEPISNVQSSLTKLTAPTVSVDQTTGIATFVKADGVSYVYKIGEDGEETAVPENGEIQLEKGQTVYVKAKGDGETTSDSEWSVGKTYSNVDPDTLPALDKPVITVNANGTFGWTAVEGAAGYKYKVGDGEEHEVNAETLSITNAPLTAGQTVQVMAVGDMVNNKDSEYETAKYVKKLPDPTVEISLSGVVTVTADANATKVVYVVGDGTETDYDANNKPVLTNGQTIKVTAKGNGEAYSDSAVVEKTFTEIEVISYAVFMSNDTAVGTTVAVTGVVTALRDNKVYFQDNDGGYYAYNATSVPENLAVGMTVKVVGVKAENKGLTQINTATVEITNETVTPVEPVDLTTAEITALAELEAYQNRLVVIKGITVAAFSSSYTVKIGGVDVPVYVGGKSQIVDDNGQAAFKKAFNDNIGKTGDLTCIVSIYNTVQLVPANTTPLSNLHGAAICAKPVVTIDDDGLAKWSAVAGADKYVYKVNDGEAQEITDLTDKEEFSVQLTNNDFIVVQAVGDGTDYVSGDWSEKKTYRQFNVTIGSFVKATATTGLKVGDVIAITNNPKPAESLMTLKLGEKANNRDATAFNTKAPSSDVMLIILEQGSKENTFLMRTKEGYLYAASSDNNYLRLKGEPDEDCDWEITIDSTGVATITCKGQFTKNKLQYNSGSTNIFSCYSTKQGDVCVYINVIAKPLKTPTITIDDDGFVTIGNIDENATKVVYHIGNDEDDHEHDSEYDANNKPQLNNGQTINVTAEGDGVIYKSSFNKKTYTETPVQLLAPTVAIDETSGIVTITAKGDANGNYKDKITGYTYSVLNADKSAIEDKTDLPYVKGVEIRLDNGQWIQFKTIGQRRFKDSAYGDAVQFIKTETAKPIATPVPEVDRDGNVTWGETSGSGFTYTIKYADEENPRAAENVGEDVLSVKLVKNGTLTIKAIADPAEELQQDSAEASITYIAPDKRTTPTGVSFVKDTDNEGKVLINWTAVEGVEYSLTLVSATGTKTHTIEAGNNSFSFAIATYTSMSFKALGTEEDPENPITDGDFHTLFDDSEEVADLVGKYETDFFDSYRIEAVRTEVNAFNMPSPVDSFVKITLPVKGTAYEAVAITWEITEGGNEEYAKKIIEDNVTKLYINPAKAAASFTLKVTATLSVGDTTDSNPKEFTISVEKEDAVKFDFSSITGTNTNPDPISNLDGKLKEICGSDSNFIKVDTTKSTSMYPWTNDTENNVGSIRIGTSKNSGKLVLEFEKNIAYVVIKCAQYNGSGSNTLTINGTEITPAATTTPNEVFVTLTTAQTTLTLESSSRVCIYSLDVHFGDIPDANKVEAVEKAIVIPDPTVSEGIYTYTLPTSGAYDATIEWDVTGLVDGDDSYSNGTLTVKQRDSIATITAIATVTVGSASSTDESKPVKTIIVPKKPGGGGDSETVALTLVKDSITNINGGSGYAAYKGERTVNGYTVDTTDVMANTYSKQDVIQMKNSSGTLKVSGGTFKKIVVEFVSGSVSVTVGSNSKSLNSTDGTFEFTPSGDTVTIKATATTYIKTITFYE